MGIRMKRITKILALSLMVSLMIPFGVFAGSDRNTDKMSEKEREGYELTKKYERYLLDKNPSPNINESFFSKKDSSKNLKSVPVVIPSAYDSRDAGVVSPVMNQASTGTCWAFSAMESAQDSLNSSIKRKNPEAEPETDFSEYDLAYFIYNQPPDKLGLTGDDLTYEKITTGSAEYYNIGGTLEKTMYSLAKGIGLSDEKSASFDDLLDDLYQKGTAKLPDSFCYNNSVAALKNVEVLNIRKKITDEQRNMIKEKIMYYGAGQIGFTETSNAFDFNNYAYYISPTTSTYGAGGHGVAIVGWDDDYPVSNFKDEPPGPGAWLIKNSWSENWGIDGYFWMSYYEPSLSEIFFYDVEEAGNYDSIYQYDGNLSVETISGYVTGANVFKAEKNEILKYVSFFTKKDNTDYEVRIYKNPQEGNPASGTLVGEKSGTIAHIGYSRLDIDAVELKKGDTFSVVIRQTVDQEATLMAIDCDYSTSDVTVNCAAHDGQSYVSKKGSGWTADDWEDISSDGSTNLRIKAFTTTKTKEPEASISFKKDEYEMDLGSVIPTDVLSAGKSILASTNLSFSSADEKIAFVDSLGHVYGRKVGETDITVKCGDKTAVTHIKVNSGIITKIDLSKKKDYATQEKPLKANLMDYITLIYDVNPTQYRENVIFDIAFADGDKARKYVDYYAYHPGEYKFYTEGTYKITARVDGEDGIEGSSLEFYLELTADVTECGSDYTKIRQNPYKNNKAAIFNYYDPLSVSNVFTLNYDTEIDYDYLYILGMDKKLSNQDIFKYAMYLSDDYEIDDDLKNAVKFEEILNGEGKGKNVVVAYPYVSFIMVSDMYQTGSFSVESVDSYVLAENMVFTKSDLHQELKTGGEAVINIATDPVNAFDGEIKCLVDDSTFASASYADGKVTIKAGKIGNTDVYVYFSDEDPDEETAIDIDSDDEGTGILKGRVFRISVNVTAAQSQPDTFEFKDSDIELERNSKVDMSALNDDAWDGYIISYESEDPTVVYVDYDNTVVAAACGQTKITATVTTDKGELTATQNVTVTEPDRKDFNNLQNVHNYVFGMEDFYIYEAPEGTECMNLYFDYSSSFDTDAYITISDGNGTYYGYDSSGNPITTEAKSDTGIDKRFCVRNKSYLTTRPFTIYGDKAVIHFVSTNASGKNPVGVMGSYYGFRVKKVETGKIAKGLSIKNGDINLSFDKYGSNEATLKVQLEGEDAIDKVYYRVDDSSVASIDKYGVITGNEPGETTAYAYTLNGDESLEDSVKITVSEKAVENIIFYDSYKYPETIEEYEGPVADVSVAIDDAKEIGYTILPWGANMGDQVFFDFDDDALNVNFYGNFKRGCYFSISGNKLGAFPIEIYTSESDERDEPVFTFNVTVTPPECDEEFDSEKIDVDGNDGVAPEELAAEDIFLQQGDDGDVESIYWTFKREGADYIEISFDKLCDICEPYGWLYIYDSQGKMLGQYTGDRNIAFDEYRFAGETIRVDGDGFIIALIAPENKMSFAVSDIYVHYPGDDRPDPEPADVTPTPTPSPEGPSVTPAAPSTSPTPTPTPAAEAKTPKVGDVVKDSTGKGSYKILSDTTVEFNSPSAKNPASFEIPAAVTIEGKTYQVTEIAANAFKNNKKLKKVVIGKNIIKIGKSAFQGCKKLKDIRIKGKNLKTVGKNSIKGINKKAVIRCPKAKKKAYKKLFNAKTGYKKSMKMK